MLIRAYYPRAKYASISIYKLLGITTMAQKNKSSKKPTTSIKTSSPSKLIIGVLTAALLFSVITYTAIHNSPKNIVAKAYTPYSTCWSFTTNTRIACIAGNFDLLNYRYANCDSCGRGTAYWGPYWMTHGYPDLNMTYRGFGNNPARWWANRADTNQNFLDCSGFVNVVFYLATGIDPESPPPQNANSVRATALSYINSGNLTKITDLTNGLQPGDILIKSGGDWHHSGIFTEYIPVGPKYPVKQMRTVEGVNDNDYRSGYRQRDVTWYTYALRYNKPLQPLYYGKVFP
jgi:cell wall-associated NlpC family hydrolase